MEAPVVKAAAAVAVRAMSRATRSIIMNATKIRVCGADSCAQWTASNQFGPSRPTRRDSTSAERDFETPGPNLLIFHFCHCLKSQQVRTTRHGRSHAPRDILRSRCRATDTDECSLLSVEHRSSLPHQGNPPFGARSARVKRARKASAPRHKPRSRRTRAYPRPEASNSPKPQNATAPRVALTDRSPSAPLHAHTHTTKHAAAAAARRHQTPPPDARRRQTHAAARRTPPPRRLQRHETQIARLVLERMLHVLEERLGAL